MKKIFTIRREDFFKANNGLPADVQVMQAGSIWLDVALTDEEKANYKFPIN